MMISDCWAVLPVLRIRQGVYSASAQLMQPVYTYIQTLVSPRMREASAILETVPFRSWGTSETHAHLLVPKANLVTCRCSDQLRLLADSARGNRRPVGLFDTSGQDQTEPVGLFAVNCHAPIDSDRHHVSRGRTHDHEHHCAVVDVFHLEKYLPMSRNENGGRKSPGRDTLS